MGESESLKYRYRGGRVFFSGVRFCNHARNKACNIAVVKLSSTLQSCQLLTFHDSKLIFDMGMREDDDIRPVCDRDRVGKQPACAEFGSGSPKRLALAFLMRPEEFPPVFGGDLF